MGRIEGNKPVKRIKKERKWCFNPNGRYLGCLFSVVSAVTEWCARDQLFGVVTRARPALPLDLEKRRFFRIFRPEFVETNSTHLELRRTSVADLALARVFQVNVPEPPVDDLRGKINAVYLNVILRSSCHWKCTLVDTLILILRAKSVQAKYDSTVSS